jgi:hypothetical protein
VEQVTVCICVCVVSTFGGLFLAIIESGRGTFFVDLEWAWHCDESRRDPVVLVVGCAWTLLHGFHMFFH